MTLRTLGLRRTVTRRLRPLIRRRVREVRRARAIERRWAGVERVEGWTRPASLRPSDRDSTVVCSWGYAESVYALDTPETRTPAWWRARLPVGVAFTLTLHPIGTGPRGRDAAAGLRRRVDLGTWRGAEVPSVPIGVPASEVVILGATVRARASLATVRDGVPEYTLPPVALAQLAPAPQTRAPRTVALVDGGRVEQLIYAGQGADALHRYRRSS